MRKSLFFKPKQKYVIYNSLGIFILSAILFFSVFLGESYASAIEEIHASAQYILGDNDSKLDGRRLALMESKRNALEKAGTYIESFTEVKNFQLTQDQVRSYAAGILEVKETGEKWDKVGDNLAVTLTVKVKVDKNVVAKQLAAIRKNSETARELEESRAKIQEYEKKIAEMNHQLKLAKKPGVDSGQEPQKPQQQIENIKATRDKALTKIDIETLLVKAGVALTGSEDPDKAYAAGTTSAYARNRAKMFIQEAVNLEPENPEVLSLLAVISIEEKDYSKAEMLLRKALNIDSSFTLASYNLGMVYFSRDNFTEAEQNFKRALSLAQDAGVKQQGRTKQQTLEAASHFMLGQIYRKKGDLYSAEWEMREGIRLRPNEGIYIGNLGYVLYEQGKTTEAKEVWEKGCRLGHQTI